MQEPGESILKFQPNALEAVRKMYGYNSAKDIKDAVDILEEWIMKQNHFKKKDFDRDYLEIAIIHSKGSIEKAKKRLDRLCTFHTLLPRFFGDFDINKDFKEFDGVLKQLVVPTQTKDYSRVLIIRNSGNKFQEDFIIQYFRYTLLFMEYVKKYEYSMDIIVVLDYRELNLTEFVLKSNLMDLQEGMRVATEAYGVRIKGIHIISQSKTVEIVVKLFKQALSEKIGGRIMVHKDLDTLLDHVPKEVLPKDFGGEERSLDEIYADWLKVLGSDEHKNYIREINKACTDESLREKTTFNDEYMGMPGTFRSLNLD